jgi:hypothetical protein
MMLPFWKRSSKEAVLGQYLGAGVVPRICVSLPCSGGWKVDDVIKWMMLVWVLRVGLAGLGLVAGSLRI